MRRRARIRQKALVVDDTTTLDLETYEPQLALGTNGRGLWEQLAADPPFWWSEHDLPAAALMCGAWNAATEALEEPENYAGKAALLKECRQFFNELGLSPTARGRLKLTEAQGVAAAKKIEQLESDHKRKKTQAVGIDELMADG